MNLFRFSGTIDRKTYALIGFLGSAVKIALDNVVARLVFDREWGLFSYWSPISEAAGIFQLSLGDETFLATMVAIALPFIWVGTALTLRRLRDVGLPLLLVVFFFVPVVNIPFLLLLCVYRGQGAESPATKSAKSLPLALPSGPFGSALLAALVTAFPGGLLVYGTIEYFQDYGLSLFLALPFVMGFVSTCLYMRKQPRSLLSSVGVTALSMVLLAVGLLFVKIEGAVCIVMAAPLGFPLAALGASVAHSIGGRSSQPMITGLLFVMLPGIHWAEKAMLSAPTVYEVKSDIEINARPEVVWNEVVAFAEIPPPTEFLFRAGIAYPIRAEIHGTGVGAERRCVFSTGAFVEPIEVWDAPRLLKFSVTSNPPPMEEWTPYKHIDPPHLHGFLVSSGGQFLLTPLPGGRTRVEGTTWYRHSLNPERYWKWWSDAIIHRIHMRVLRHIRDRAERS
jgi:uncharacterized membrane protein YhaH (DUF805 family)